MKQTMMVYTLLFVALVLWTSATALALPAASLPPNVVVEEYVKGLNFPVKMTALPNGDLLVTEKLGTVRLIQKGVLLEEPVLELRVKFQNEGGLLGIELMPDYKESGEFLVVYTPRDDPEHMYVSKFELNGTLAIEVADPWLKLPSKPNTDRHYAGTLRFAPSGDLFITTGDLRDAQLSQNLNHLAGSVLRYQGDLAIPADNPFGAESPIYSYGHRNPFGLSIARDGTIFLVENGDDVGDELNVIEAGNNYGWPLIQGYCDNYPKHEPCENRSDFTDPAHEFRTVIGPTGMWFYEEDMLPALRDTVLVTGWHSRALHRLEWDRETRTIVPRGVLMVSPVAGAGFVDVIADHDGAVLVMASGQNAGHIYRIASKDKVLNPHKLIDISASHEVTGGGCSVVSQRGLVMPKSMGLIVVLFLGAVGWRRK